MKAISRILLVGGLFLFTGFSSFAQNGSGFGGFGDVLGHSDFNSPRGMERSRMMNLMAYLKTKEEGGNLKSWWKGEETFGIAYGGSATYKTTIKSSSDGPSNGPLPDTEIRISMTPKVGFHLNANSNHLLVRVSDNSIVTFSAGVQMDFLGWTYAGNSLSNGKKEQVSIGYVQAGVPLTLDFKMGADVDFDRTQKIAFAIGGGFYPRFGFAYSGVDGDVPMDAKMTPYLYASFGFFAGACWKIRASYMPGNFSIMNYSQDLNGMKTTTGVTGPGMYTLGIGIMDWSWDWGKGSAWRGSNGGGHVNKTRRYHIRDNMRMF